MERIDALISCANWVLIMLLSSKMACGRPHSGEPWGRAQPETGLVRDGPTDDVAGAHRAGHRRGARGDVLRALAAQLRAAPRHHRAGERARRHGATQSLRRPLAARA